MPLQATSGAASYDAFGGGVVAEPNYIESVFSTYLYTGNGSTQTITNGIDLSTKGGMVWIKKRSDAGNNYLMDTVRGLNTGVSPPAAFSLISDRDSAQGTSAELTAFNLSGFTLGSSSVMNGSPDTYASWTFRKQPKFFDVVTWTGSNDSGTNIGKGIVSHNLGSAPGCVIVKNTTSGSTNWIVYHRSLSGGYRMLLNTTDAQTNTGSVGYFSKYTDGVGWAQTNPDANNIYVGYNYQTNDNGATMVAYLFAHDAGGFGLTGTDNVISCGSYTGTGADQSIPIGFEPQWLLIKKSSGISDWAMFDNMRGATVLGVADSFLKANGSNAEYNAEDFVEFYADGFKVDSAQSSINGSGDTMIYIAIRRGPMKVPTLGTSVFDPNLGTGSGAPRFVSDFPTDLFVKTYRYGYLGSLFGSRLTGDQYMSSAATSAEASDSTFFKFDYQNGTSTSGDSNDVGWSFKRAPSFFDEVCYKGTGANRTVAHNLTVAPELMIIKDRSYDWGEAWAVYSSALGATKYLYLYTTTAQQTSSSYFNNTAPTSSVFTVGTNAVVNAGGDTYVAYLFATCAGVSKVGSYTGTATTLQIDCGFTGGARFVLIKRTDSTGDWYVWDSARGIVAGNDSYLLLNSTAAEVTSTDYIDTYSAGFEISSTAPAAINASGGTYIFLAIA